MNLRPSPFWLLLGLVAPAWGEETEIAAVYSAVHNGYQRQREADGSYRIETYTLGEGGFSAGSLKDASVDHLKFLDIAQVLAGPLAQQNYRPGPTSDKADLLIMVYWGRTTGLSEGGYGLAQDGLKDAMGMGQAAIASAASEMVDSTTVSGPAARAAASRGVPGTIAKDDGGRGAAREQMVQMIEMQNRIRDRANARNAALLGYVEELARTADARQFAGLGAYRQDLLTEIEEDRYYVVLMACDYATFARDKKFRVFWETRFSLRARGHAFDRNLPDMAKHAAKYFGQGSRGLRREDVPMGRVEVGKPYVVEETGEPKK